MFICLFIVTIVLILPISGQSSATDQCYKNVQNEFNNSLQDPPKFSVPDEFRNIKSLMDRVKIIISKIENSEDSKKKLDNVEDKLNKTHEQLELVKIGIGLLKQVKQSAEKLKKQTTFNKATHDVCFTSKEKFDKLKKDVEEIEKQKPKIDTTLEELKANIDRINAESMEIQKKLEKIHVPDYVSDKYLCDKDIFKTFKEMIKMSIAIKKELESVIDRTRSELKTLKEKLELNNVKEEIPDVPLTKDQLQAEIKYFREKLKEAKRLRNVVEKKNKLKQYFDGIEKVTLELCRKSVCNIQVSVDVEN